jgi:hypothetical protein
VADRTAVLVDGRVRQLGPTAAVLDRPADADCARLLGFDTVLSADAAARLLRTPPFGPAALRAEDCRAAPPGGAGVEATLRRVLPWGAVTRVLAELGGETVAATAPAPPPAWLASARPGDALALVVADRSSARVLRTGASEPPLRPTEPAPKAATPAS